MVKRMRIEDVLGGVTVYSRDGVRYLGVDFRNLWDGMTPNAIVMRPEAWRALKPVKLKVRAKRRARARMRSRGYVAHGRRA
jgi:hypothetical protein